MQRYHRLRIFTVAALLVELVIGLGGALFPRAEIFPFTSWFLFSLVPGKTTGYDIILTAAGERPLTPALRFSSAGPLVEAPHAIVFFEIIQRLGRAVDARDPQAEDLRWQIESQFTVPSMHYDLVKETYFPVARWEFNQVLSRVPIHSYVAGQP